jgi:hypothetical protein
MFAHGGGADSEDRTDLGVGFSVILNALNCSIMPHCGAYVSGKNWMN